MHRESLSSRMYSFFFIVSSSELQDDDAENDEQEEDKEEEDEEDEEEDEVSQFGEFGIGSTNNPLIDIFLNSYLLSAWYCGKEKIISWPIGVTGLNRKFKSCKHSLISPGS